MTDDSDTPNKKVEYIVMCYDGYGKADNAIDALLRLIQKTDRGFEHHGDTVDMIFHKGRNSTIDHSGEHAQIDTEEKISETRTQMKTETLQHLEMMLEMVANKAGEKLDDKGVVQKLQNSE